MKTTFIVTACAACLLAGTGANALAGDDLHGASLLDASREAQLERWLGAGDLNLDNVYTLRPGDTSADFHAAADGKGPTFNLLQVTNKGGAGFLVGGYNPQSWASDEGWHETPYDWQRTAFLFNMTVPAVYHQVSPAYVLPSQGLRQTFNDAAFGPVFGSGPDLFVDDQLRYALSWQLSYGNPVDESRSIIDGTLRGQVVGLDALEVYAISPVPEPANAAMLLAGLGVLGACMRRARRRACMPQ
jgi:hypothetical protein